MISRRNGKVRKKREKKKAKRETVSFNSLGGNRKAEEPADQLEAT